MLSTGKALQGDLPGQNTAVGLQKFFPTIRPIQNNPFQVDGRDMAMGKGSHVSSKIPPG